MPRRDELPKETDDRIAWVLDHPGTSPWLKTALETALQRDPIAIVNDLEILNLLLRARWRASLDRAFPSPPSRLRAGLDRRDEHT
jgi:hypothetical protein